MKKNNKKFNLIAIIAILTTITGVIVAVFAYLKKKANSINEKLDFDGDIYFEDDDSYLEVDYDFDNRNEKDPQKIIDDTLDEIENNKK